MPKALASLPSGRDRRVSLATPAMESSMVSRRRTRRSRCIFKKGVSFAGSFLTGRPFGTVDLGASLVSSTLGALAAALGALFSALAGAAFGFLTSSFFGCDFGMITGFRKEKGGRDTQFAPPTQGEMG